MRIQSLFALALCCSLPLGGANAATVTVDGIKTVADGYLKSFSFNWHNNHKVEGTAYPEGGPQTADAYWSMSGTTFNLYVEVPPEAKNSMWGTALIADAAEMDAYFFENTHYHHGANKAEDKAGFKTMTESEHFLFAGNQLVSWDKDSGKQTTSGDWDSVVTSLEWVLANGCDTSSCDKKGISMSFEAEYLNFSEQDRIDLIAAIQGSSVMLHLSDERQGGVSEVPLPAAAWLFGSALLGLGAIKRRKA